MLGCTVFESLFLDFNQLPAANKRFKTSASHRTFSLSYFDRDLVLFYDIYFCLCFFFQNKTFQVTFFKNESQLEDFDASDAGGNLDFGIIFDEIPHEKVICIFYDSQPDLRFTDRATCIF